MSENNTLKIQISNYNSPEEIYDTLADNEISDYETDLDILSDILILVFKNSNECLQALDVIEQINKDVPR